MQHRVRGMALVAALAGGLTLAAPTAAQQYYPSYNPSDPSYQYYPQGYNTTDPNSQYYQYFGYNQQGYGQQGYGQPYSYGYTQPYNYGGYAGSGYAYPPGGYGGYSGYNYGNPYAYQGYGSPYAPQGYGYAYSPYPQQQYPNYYGSYAATGAYAPGYAGAPPYAPTSGSFTVTATPVGANQASLQWTTVPGASSYSIYTGVNGGTLTFSSTNTSTTATVPVNGPNTVFQIHAIGPNGFEVGVSTISQPVNGAGYGYAGAPYGGYPYPPPGGYPPYSGGYSTPPGGYPPAPSYQGTGQPGQPFPGTSTAFFTPNPVSITTSAQLAVTVLDVNRQPVVGRTVYVTSSRNVGDVITPTSSPVTNGNGQAYFSVRGTQVGQATFTVTVDGTALQPVFATFNP